MVGKGQDLVIYSDEAVAPYVSFEYRFPFAVDMKSFFISLYIPHYLGCQVHSCLTFLTPRLGLRLSIVLILLFCLFVWFFLPYTAAILSL